MGSPVFRVTTYRFVASDFTGTLAKVYLRYTLSANYFAMVRFGLAKDGSTSVDNFGIQVTGDPFGTGDLTQTDGHWLELQRTGTDEGGAVGTITVIECLRATETAGFKLLTIDTVVHPDHPSSGKQTSSFTSGATWLDSSRVVPYGGDGGGGTLTAAQFAGLIDPQTLGIRWWLTSTDTVNWERYGTNTITTEEATSSIYIIEWGSEWDIQHVNITATKGGDYASSGNYGTGAAARAFSTANSWIWITGWSNGFTSGDTYKSLACVPGSGGSAAPGASESTVAVAAGTAVLWDVDAYIMTHPLLTVEWEYQALGDGTDETKVFSAAPPTSFEVRVAADGLFLGYVAGGGRWGQFLGGFNSLDNTLLNEMMFSTSMTSDTEVTVYRADPVCTEDWAGWLQVLDFGSVITPTGTEPVFRVTQVEIEPGDWSGTTFLDVALPNALLANYFVIIEGIRTDIATVIPPDDYAVRVTHDPFATGDLTASSAANIIRLSRIGSTGDWSGVLTVVECLRSFESAGFRLRTVKECGGSAAGDSGVDTQFFSHTATVANKDKLMVLAGPRGGGVTAVTTNASDMPAVYLAGYPVGDDVIALTRYNLSSSFMDAYVASAYLVEWGGDWGVQIVRYTGDADNLYTLIELDEDITVEQTWIHSFVAAYDNEPNDGASSVVVVPGDGMTASGVVSTLAVSFINLDESAHVVSYLLSHPDIVIQWDTTNMSNSELTDDITIDAPARGEAYGTTTLGHPYTIGYRWATTWSAVNEVTGGQLAQVVPWTRLTASTVVRVERGQHGSLALTGWTETVDVSGIGARTFGTGFEDDDGTYGPIQGLVIRNRWLDRSTLSADQEGGPMSGPVVPGNSNLGSIYGFQEGVPNTAAAKWISGSEKEIEILAGLSGKLNGTAGILARKGGEDATRWTGMNALTCFRNQASPEQADFKMGAAVYSSKFNRMIVLRAASATTLRVHYVDIEQNPVGAWTTVDVEVLADAAWDQLDVGMDCVELPDGALLLLYQSIDPIFSALFSPRTAISEDGGLTWTEIGRFLASAVAGTTAHYGDWKMAVSGDYVRVLYTESTFDAGSATLNDLRSWVSSDRGRSWKTVTTIASELGIRSTPSNQGGVPYAITGVGDQAGTMLMALYNSSTDDNTTIWTATGEGDWVESGALEIDWTTVGYGDVLAQWLCNTPYGIFLIAMDDDGSTNCGFWAYHIDPSDVTDPDNWTSWGRIADFDGIPENTPADTKAFWAGDRIALYGSMIDYSDSAGDNFVQGCMIMMSGGWDVLPWTWADDGYTFSQTMWNVEGGYRTMGWATWWAWMGNPSSGLGSEWTAVASGSTGFSERSDYFERSVTTSNTAYFNLNRGTPGGDEQWESSAHHLIIAIVSQRVGINSENAEHMGWKIEPNTSGSRGSVTVRMDVDKIVVYDNIGAATLYTDTTVDLTTPHEFRWAMSETTSFNKMCLSYRPVGGLTDDWTKTVELTFSTTTVANQLMLVGILTAGGSSGTSKFRIYEVFSRPQNHVGQATNLMTFPDSLFGTPITKNAVHVVNGIALAWGGSGLAEGDTYAAKVDYTRGVEGLLLDSPRMMWESEDLTEVAVVIGAGTSESLTNARWETDVVMLMGTVDRTATLQFASQNTDAAWDAPAESIQLSADLYNNLVVVDVDGSCIKLEAESGEPLPPVAETVNLFIRFVSSGSKSGETHRIYQDPEAGVGWFQLDGEAPAQGTYSAGSSAVIFMDRMVFKGSAFNRYKYARVLFPDVSSVGNVTEADGIRAGGTATGTHRLGTIILGSWVPFDVPFDWTFTDNEQGNVTEQRTKGGFSWAQKEGPNQRTITGRIIGDVNEFRRKLRRMLGKYADFSRAPTGLVLDGKNINPDTLILMRWQSGSQQDEAGWYQDSDGVWRTVGDASIVCVEVT